MLGNWMLNIYVSVCVLLMCVSWQSLSLSASAEGLHAAWGAAADGCGVLAGLHHVSVWSVRHHEEQRWRAVQSAGLPHILLSERGTQTTLHTWLTLALIDVNSERKRNEQQPDRHGNQDKLPTHLVLLLFWNSIYFLYVSSP